MPALNDTVAVPAAVLAAAKRLAREKPATISADDAQKQLADILLANETVAVTRDGKTAAVLLSAKHYHQWQKLLASIMSEAEDREWAKKAEQAEAEGTIGAEKSAAIMRELRGKYGD